MIPPIWQSLQFEDILLFVWLAIVEPILNQIVTRLLGDVTPFTIGSSYNPVLAILALLAGVGGLVVVGTRAPHEEDPLKSTSGAAAFAHLPMIVTVGYMFLYGLTSLNAFNDTMVGLVPCLIFAYFIGVGMLFNRLPVLDVVYRRILIAPMILLGSWSFAGLMQTFFAGADVRGFLTNQLPQILSNPNGSLAFVTGLFFAAVVVFYLIFVFAPRQIAYPTGSGKEWVIRFIVYMAAIVLNLTWFQVF